MSPRHDGEATPRPPRVPPRTPRRGPHPREGPPGRPERDDRPGLLCAAARRLRPRDRDTPRERLHLPWHNEFGRGREPRRGGRRAPPRGRHDGRSPRDRQRDPRHRGVGHVPVNRRAYPASVGGSDARADELPEDEGQDEQGDQVRPVPDDPIAGLESEPLPGPGEKALYGVLEDVAAIQGDSGERVRGAERHVEPEEPIDRVPDEPEEGRGDRREGPVDLVELEPGLRDRGVPAEREGDVREDGPRDPAEAVGVRQREGVLRRRVGCVDDQERTARAVVREDERDVPIRRAVVHGNVDGVVRLREVPRPDEVRIGADLRAVVRGDDRERIDPRVPGGGGAVLREPHDPDPRVDGGDGAHHDRREEDREDDREDDVRRGTDRIQAGALPPRHLLHLFLVRLDERPDGDDEEEDAQGAEGDLRGPREDPVGELVEDDRDRETEHHVPEGDEAVDAGEAQEEIRGRRVLPDRGALDEGRLPGEEYGRADHRQADEHEGEVPEDLPEARGPREAVEEVAAPLRLPHDEGTCRVEPARLEQALPVQEVDAHGPGRDEDRRDEEPELPTELGHWRTRTKARVYLNPRLRVSSGLTSGPARHRAGSWRAQMSSGISSYTPNASGCTSFPPFFARLLIRSTRRIQ